ncbi:CD1375 family protein [Caproiciproducens sp. CPB-2]|nr:CD1375 family protein [Caproiciproducens sp. CPB-2]MDF1494064.1 CD1375 family protein [Caproiciproducens sp. CPB-2]
MEKVYADLIKKGLKSIEEVPERIRDAVRAIVEAESGNTDE